MKKICVLVALFVASIFGGPASADQRHTNQVFNWTGFYVGAHVGYALGEDRFSGRASGAAGGVQLGYNSQFSNVVIGLEADLTGADIDGGLAHSNIVGTVRGRVGLTIDRVLLYVTAGVMAADYEDYLGNRAILSGLVTGAGVEWMFAQQWSAKFEYLVGELNGGIDISTFKVGVNYRF